MKSKLLLVALVLMAAPSVAMADNTADFSTLGWGFISSPVTVNGVTANGYVWDGTQYLQTDLFGRNNPNDHGLGVCNHLTEGQSLCESAGGDVNELDNMGSQEIIGLSLPAHGSWVSVQVSSLDGIESGALFACMSMCSSPNTATGTYIWWFAAPTDAVEATFNIPLAYQFAPTLFFVPFDWQNGCGPVDTSAGCNLNNDFLVYQATWALPEPGTMALLGIGLGALGLTRLRRRQA